MKEEQYLIEKLGKENPFRVPDDYFDSLTSQVMARVDAEKKQPAGPKARTVWLRPVLYAAASVCALFVSVVAYHNYSALDSVSGGNKSGGRQFIRRCP